jgi:sensitive to high expression protein 9
VVALLERKHSWSAADLERYMSLIRSEHVNDQAVREAKDAVLAAESSLEEARAQLEKRERAQYHEEQIWSDTIRRNSTWVTFGLMGFNIFLLLLSLAILEPWRRRRMVREIKATLEAQKPVVEAPTTIPTTAMIEEAIDKSVEHVIQPQEDVAPVASLITSTSGEHPASTAPKVRGNVQAETADLAYNTTNPATEPPAPLSPDQMEPAASVSIINVEEASKDMAWLDKATTRLKDLKSKEPVTVRKQDLTVLFCAGATAGWLFTTVVFLIMNRSP